MNRTVWLPLLALLVAGSGMAQTGEDALDRVVELLAMLQEAPPPPATPAPPARPARAPRPVAVQEAPEPPQPPQPAQARAFALVAGSGSYLGVGIADIDSPERAKALKLSEERGVEITRVDEESPAAKAGIKEGDVVLDYNGQRVDSVEQFQRMVRETPVGRTVKLGVSRNGATQFLTATLGRRKSPMAWRLGPEDEGKWRREMEKMQQELGQMRFQMPDMPQAFMAWRTTSLGIEAESLTPQLAEFFGVKDGVLVRSVVRESAAEKAGIKAGDVITKVDGAPVRTPSDVSSKIRGLAERRTFPITVVRNRGEIGLSVTIEEKQPKMRTMAPQKIKTAPFNYKYRIVVPRGRTISTTPLL